ncbi:hypothetical protein BGX23_011268 [Mortierella sp. AD031]|nr:hypothetical protein BGX23_011268 [Mortierella sp. AD031]
MCRLEGVLWEPTGVMPTLEIPAARRALRDIARGLRYLHACSILLRDIEPQHVLVSEDGARLGDFGLAIDANDEKKGWTGTRRYCAPEVKCKQEYHFPADIFSLGVYAHEMLAGEKGVKNVSNL